MVSLGFQQVGSSSASSVFAAAAPAHLLRWATAAAARGIQSAIPVFNGRIAAVALGDLGQHDKVFVLGDEWKLLLLLCLLSEEPRGGGAVVEPRLSTQEVI